MATEYIKPSDLTRMKNELYDCPTQEVADRVIDELLELAYTNGWDAAAFYHEGGLTDE